MPQAKRNRSTPTEREHELAMAIATKQRPEKSTRVTITNDNAKHAVHTTVEVTDPDPQTAWQTAALLMERSLDQFGDPARENGAGK